MINPGGEKVVQNTTAQAQQSTWPVVRIDQITEPDAPVVYGILQAGPNVRSGVPYVRPTEIQDDKILLGQLLRTSQNIAERYRRSALKSGDVILSIVGTIGKIAIVPPDLEGGNINQSAVRIRPRRDVMLPQFLAWVLRSPIATRQYEAVMVGSAVMRLNVAHVRALLLPVPPLSRQREILADIEQRLTRLEAVVALLNRVQSTLRRYAFSVLKTACKGKLVENEAKLGRLERRDYTSAAQLLESTPPAPRPNRWKSRTTDHVPGHAALAIGQPPSRLPSGWAWAPLPEVAEMASGHTPGSGQGQAETCNAPWLTCAIRRCGFQPDPLRHRPGSAPSSISKVAV